MGESTKLLPLLTWRGALRHSDLPPTTRHVALALSLYMSEAGESAYPGATRLARDTGLSERAVRDHLGHLVRTGWLAVVERGGIKGEARRANAYRSLIPLQQLQGSEPTPAGDAPVPLQLTALTPAGDAPHLFKNSPLNSSGGTNGASAVPDSRVQELVAGYVEDYQSERQGHSPQPAWKAAAGKAAKTALAAGESPKDIAGCFQVIAHEGKNPNTLAYVLADSHAGRERRMR